MPCAPIDRGIVCLSDVGEVVKNGRVIHFEWHSYFGPYPIRVKDGQPWEKPPGEKHWFWDAAAEWKRRQDNVAS